MHIGILFCVVFLILVHHIHSENNTVFNEEYIEQTLDTNPNITINGHFLCAREEIEWANPYLRWKSCLKSKLAQSYCDKDGYFKLSIAKEDACNLNETLEMVIRHQCYVKDLPEYRGCAIPFYTTVYPMNICEGIPDKMIFNLEDAKDLSIAECL